MGVPAASCVTTEVASRFVSERMLELVGNGALKAGATGAVVTTLVVGVTVVVSGWVVVKASLLVGTVELVMLSVAVTSLVVVGVVVSVSSPVPVMSGVVVTSAVGSGNGGNSKPSCARRLRPSA